jgi:serine/threonine protein kinase
MTRTPTQTGGSLLWAAPELFKGGSITNESDIYAFGVVCWELATSELPYENVSTKQIAVKVAKNELRPNLNDGPGGPFHKVRSRGCTLVDAKVILWVIGGCGVLARVF